MLKVSEMSVSDMRRLERQCWEYFEKEIIRNDLL